MKRYSLSVGLLVVLSSLVIVQTVQASSPFPPQLRDDPVTEAAPYTRYENVVLGARLEYPAAWRLTEDEYLLPTYGFTLADKSGGLVLRVGWVHEAAPEQMELLIARQIQGHPGLDIQRVPVTIAGYSGVLLAPLPGIEPVTCIYLLVEGRVYEIWQRAEPRSIQETSLVAALRFETPRQSLTDLALPAADGLFLQAPVQPLSETPAPTAASGCVDWPEGKFLRVPWDSGANGDGGTNAGPSYYGEGWHKNCNRTDRSNDYHALDFRLREWDRVRAPAAATVLHFGWASGGFSTLGRVVVLDVGDGYQYLAAHLRGFGAIWYPGQAIASGTVIGYAGGSGNNQDGYFGNHLHQAIYKGGTLGTSGGVYGGQGVEPRDVRYYGHSGGTYETITRHQHMNW